MERLTFDGNFCDIVRCLEACGGKNCPDGYCSQRKVWERLKAYEDTGLTPEHITGPFLEDATVRMAGYYLGIKPARLRELAQADQDERLVVPLKVGDVLYEADAEHGVITHTVADIHWAAHTNAIDDAGNKWYDFYSDDDIASAHLTREEAKAALAEAENGKKIGR